MSSGTKTPSSSAVDGEVIVREAETEVDHDLIVVDEFDALSIELKSVPPQTAPKDNSPEEHKLKPSRSWLQNAGKYPAKKHARKVAMELGVRSGIVYLPGLEEQLYEDSDQSPEFRQRRHFYYLTGAGFPGCAVTYDIKHDYLILWVPHTNARAVLWSGRTPSPDECKAASDLDDVRYIYDLDRFLHRVLVPGSTLYVLRPSQSPKLGYTKAPVHIDTTQLAPAIERARVIKTEHEIALIRRANIVSSAAHKAVMTKLKTLSDECGIEGLFLGFCISMGAKHQAYPVIAASGSAASTLHYTDNNQALKGQQLVVLDAGAEWNCYASDITRTLPVSGTFSKEAAAIYRIVERMQNECIQQVRPGVMFYRLHLHACMVAIDELLKLGILRGRAPEIISKGTIAAFFPHGLGHHLGLEVHDVSGRGRLLSTAAVPVISTGPCRRAPPKRAVVLPEVISGMFRAAVKLAHPPAVGRPQIKDLPGRVGRQKLEENMVVTIEPGIYFCREYLESFFLNDPVHAEHIDTKELDKYWDVGGVRIEDDILVTKDGYENLTVAPKGEEMLKVINGRV